MSSRAARCIVVVSAAVAALPFVLGCSSVAEVSNPVPRSPSQPFVPAAGQTPLQIVVTFLSGPYPGDGGSASVLRMDSTQASRCGTAACLVLIGYQASVGHTGLLSLPVGSYEVTYRPPTGYRLADNVVNPQTVTVPNPPPPRMLVTFAVTP